MMSKPKTKLLAGFSMLEAVLSLGLISILFLAVWQLHSALNSETRELSRLHSSLIYEAYSQVKGKPESLTGETEKLLTTKTLDRALVRTYLKLDEGKNRYFSFVAESKTRQGRPVVTAVSFYPRVLDEN